MQGRKTNDPKTRVISTRINDITYRHIKDISDRDNISISDAVRDIVTVGIDNYDISKPIKCVGKRYV